MPEGDTIYRTADVLGRVLAGEEIVAAIEIMAHQVPIDVSSEARDDDTDTVDVVVQPDADRDGVRDGLDNCPNLHNPDQADMDGDEAGDECDPDADGDGLPNDDETGFYGTDPANADTDGDGVNDSDDPFPTNGNFS